MRQWLAFRGMQKLFGSSNFSYFPPTFVLPHSREALQAAEARGEGPFVHKVSASSRGVGVTLVDPVAEEHLR